jgi:hypothetical protein
LLSGSCLHKWSKKVINVNIFPYRLRIVCGCSKRTVTSGANRVQVSLLCRVATLASGETASRRTPTLSAIIAALSRWVVALCRASMACLMSNRVAAICCRIATDLSARVIATLSD